MSLNIEPQIVSFEFSVYWHGEIRSKINDMLRDYVGTSYDERDWICEVAVELNGYRGTNDQTKVWSVCVTAGYVGDK